MAKSYDEVRFAQAIADKDYKYIKTCIISAIKNNPGFRVAQGAAASEAKLALEQVRAALPDIVEKHQTQPDETILNEFDRSNWTKEVFYEKCFLLGENFSLMRYSELQKLGQYLYNNGNFYLPQDQEQPEEQVQKHLKRCRNLLPILIALGAGAVALVVLVVLLAGK